jgi:hypothetical protein
MMVSASRLPESVEKLQLAQRQRICARWVDRAVRRYLPAALDRAHRQEEAMSLRAMTPVKNPKTAMLAERSVMRIYIDVYGKEPDHPLVAILQSTLMALTRISVPGKLDAAVATAIARDTARAAGVTGGSVWRLQTAEVEDLLLTASESLSASLEIAA